MLAREGCGATEKHDLEVSGLSCLQFALRVCFRFLFRAPLSCAMGLPAHSLLLAALLSASYFLPAILLGDVCRWLFLIYAALIVLSWCVPPWRGGPSELLPSPDAFALVTGATSGLGTDLSLLLAVRGWNVVLLGRDSKKLAALQKTLHNKYGSALGTRRAQRFEVVEQDLGVPGAAQSAINNLRALGFDVPEADVASPSATTTAAASSPGAAAASSAAAASRGSSSKHISILVNNAGFATVEDFLATPLMRLEEMIFLHCTATVGLCHGLLPGMLKRRSGRVVNVASLVGVIPSPRAAVYGATKSFLVSFTNSLSYETALKTDAICRRGEEVNVGVVLVEPGATHTGFAEKAAAQSALAFRLPLISDESKSVSRSMVAGIIDGDALIQPGLMTSLIAFVAPKMPHKFAHFVCFLLWGSGSREQIWTDFGSAPIPAATKTEHKD